MAAWTHQRLGRPADTEFHTHRTLGSLKPGLDHDRALYTTILGLAQLDQGDVEQACATVGPLFATGIPESRRVRDRLTLFRTKAADTGSTHARRWLDDLPTAH